MIKTLKQLLKGQEGLALPIVMCMLAIGGLTIAGSLNYANTCLKGSQITTDGLRGTYAAEAGIEEALWSLLNGVSPPTLLDDGVNQMTVDIQNDDQGVHTLYFGELIEAGGHSDYISVNGYMEWDAEAGAYLYTITVESLHSSEIHINEVGARIPPGFIYQADSAAIFPDNVSLDEPEVTSESDSGCFLRWLMPLPGPELTTAEPMTQTFYVEGGTNPVGGYVWAVANRTDVGAIGEITGVKCILTAEATSPGDTRALARIVAEVIISDGYAYIISWKVY
ncbi:hypothetical protein ACFLYX_01190 [Chloroflexota bacterium]